MTDETAALLDRAVLAEMQRIGRLSDPHEGDAEDLVSYAKEIVFLRRERDRLECARGQIANWPRSAVREYRRAKEFPDWHPFETAPQTGVAFRARLTSGEMVVIWFDRLGPSNAPWFDGQGYRAHWAFDGWKRGALSNDAPNPNEEHP
jgi:hypothetical protein